MANVADSIKIFTLLPAWAAVAINSDISDMPQGAIKTIVREATYALPIAELIDLDQERERLKKEISKLEDNIKKISQQLENTNFVSNAPEEIIAEKKEIVEQDKEKQEKLSKALEQLDVA